MNRLGILVFLLCPMAFAGTTPTTPTTPTTGTPLEACKSLVDATVKKDFESVKKLSVGMPSHGTDKSKEAGFDKMHKEYMSKLEKLSCTSEVVANDHAFVQAEAEGGTRLIPFLKTETGWKFDGKTYMSFYGGAHGHHDGKGKM
jgi:hypothetical protein